jgi:hypothetical protein
MTKSSTDLSKLLAKHDKGGFKCSIADAGQQLILEADVEGLIGAGRHAHMGECTIWRRTCFGSPQLCLRASGSAHVATSVRESGQNAPGASWH